MGDFKSGRVALTSSPCRRRYFSGWRNYPFPAPFRSAI